MSGLNSGSTEHVETRMTPLHEHINQVFSDLAFGKESRASRERPCAGRPPPGVSARTAALLETCRLHKNSRRCRAHANADAIQGNRQTNVLPQRPPLPVWLPGKILSRFPSPAVGGTEIGEQLSVIEEIAAQDFGYTEDEMPVWNGLEDFFTEPLAKLHDTLLVT